MIKVICAGEAVKLLVFAHRPPPHHGQSYMVELLLEALGGDVRRREREGAGEGGRGGDLGVGTRDWGLGTGDLGVGDEGEGIECYHVDCRLSRDIQDIGRARWGKLFLLAGYCLEAIWCRLRHGVKAFYYVPAPPLRSAVYRDWIVMALIRPFFSWRIYHWHAVGMTEWLERDARPWERRVSHCLLGRPDLSIVLGRFNVRDGEGMGSRRTVVVPNGVPDPCPGFETEVLPRRRARAAGRAALLAGGEVASDVAEVAGEDVGTFRVLFLSLCSRDKGLFDAVEGVALARKQLSGKGVRIRLTVAGTFWVPEEEAAFRERIGREDLRDGEPLVEYRGFVSGAEKAALMRESDCLCFPTYYAAESFGLVLVEAMAYGMPVITTRWRTIPELLPEGMTGVVDPRSPSQIAEALEALVGASDYDGRLREHFLARFTDVEFGRQMKAALLGVGKD